MPSRANLAKIHIARKELSMDDDIYRDILHVQFKKRSSADLTDFQCVKLLQHFESLGWKQSEGKPKKAKGHGRKPHNMSKSEYLAKIEALLAEAGRSWGYATGIARQMFKIYDIQFCSQDQLRSIVAALVKNAQKEGRRTK